jgi:acyl-CoA synthetase (AMP-forming)/AMP-acid ligase II
MRRDVGGWQTRLTDEMISRFARSGQWPSLTIAHSARQRAQDAPDDVAVVEAGVALTFAKLLARATRLAAALVRRGMKPGEVLSYQLPNWHEAMVVVVAASLGRFVCNPIVPIYRDAEVGFILQHSRTRIFICPAAFRSVNFVEMIERLRPRLPDLRDVMLVRANQADYLSYEALCAEEAADLIAPSAGPDPNDVSLLLFTSGTTGTPKGVLHSSNTLRSEVDAVVKFWRLTRHDVVLMPSPVTHITGHLYGIELPLATGMKAVFMERWNAAEAIDLIARHKASMTVAATPFLIELAEAVERQGVSLPTFRLFGSGGAPVPPEVVNRAMRVLPDCQAFRVYGSSEGPTVTLGVAAGDPVEWGATTDGCIFNHEVRIVDDQGKVVPDGQEGEILMRGPEVMLGYTNPQDTQDSFDADGYFRTGDLGYITHSRYITVSGRKKDLIIRGGENLSPKEIEDVIHRHPAVLEAAVVAMLHARLGEVPCAYLVLRPGMQLDEAELLAFLEEAKLARQKFPERLIVVDELPHTASGKVLKHVLRARLQQ